MNPELIKSIAVIFLRHVAPLLGGAGIMSEGEAEQALGALAVAASISYHVYKRLKGKKKEAAEDARKP